MKNRIDVTQRRRERREFSNSVSSAPLRDIFLIFTLITLFFSCKKPGCLGSAGEVTVVTRQLDNFTEIVLDNKINLILTQSTVNKMEIEAPKNLEPNITSTINNGILTIQNDGSCTWARNPDEKINVHLYFKDITKLEYKGSGDITNTDTLRLPHLLIESYTGAGNIELTMDNWYTGAYIMLESAGIKLHGKTDNCFTYTNARGQADMRDFVVKKMVIEYGGLGDTYINVTDELDAILYFKGNIYYKGNPVIKRKIEYSSGRLIKN